MHTAEKKELRLFQLAWPIFVSNILGILLGFIDVYVLSRVSDLASSAVSTACQITSLCSLIFSVVCGATSILVAQYLGRGDRERASQTGLLCILLNTSFGVVISAVVLVFHDAFLQMLGAQGELFAMASAYLGILAWGIVLDAYQGAISSILYSHGETRVSMYISASMGVLNLVLDMIMVLGLLGLPPMGVAGAAIATLIAKVVCSVLLTVVYFTRIESPAVFRCIRAIRMADVKGIFALGVPSIFDSANYNITQLIITGIVLHYLSETDIVARTYLLNIAAFFQLFTNAIASATQLMIGHRIGAGQYGQANGECMRGLKLSVLATGAISLIACVFSDQLFSIFTQNPQVIEIGRHLMWANVVVEVGRAVNVVLVGGLRGAGDVSVPVFIAACCMWVIAVGGSWLSVHLTALGTVGIWIVAGIDECVRGAIMFGRWKSKKWMNRGIYRIAGRPVAESAAEIMQ